MKIDFRNTANAKPRFGSPKRLNIESEVVKKMTQKQAQQSTTPQPGHLTSICHDLLKEAKGAARSETRNSGLPCAHAGGSPRATTTGNKNRCKNGDHYWVSAYVTPIMENSKPIGFESVRVAASDHRKKRAQGVYDRLNAGKHAIPLGKRLWLGCKDLMPVVIPGLIASAAIALLGKPVAALIALAATAITTFSYAAYIGRMLQGLLELRPEAFDSESSLYYYS